MRSAGPGVNPVVDLIFHGGHPFPLPVESRVLLIHRLDPRAWRELAVEAESWVRIRSSEESFGQVIRYLDRLVHHLQKHGNRAAGH